MASTRLVVPIVSIIAVLAAVARADVALHASVVDAVGPAELVARLRSELAPKTAVTTRALDVDAAHPAHIRTIGYSIDTVCEGTYCAEELKAGSHTLVVGRTAVSRLRARVSDAGKEALTSADEAVLPRPAIDPRWLSIYRVASDYTRGAAHARGWLACETYNTASGSRAALRDVVGDRIAARVFTAATRALASSSAASAYRLSSSSFLVAEGGVVMCAIGERTAAGDDLVEITVATR